MFRKNGDSVVATLSYYKTGLEAENAYNAAKNTHGSYRVVEIAIGDEGYAWQYKSQSEVGFLEGQIVGVVDYFVSSGTASIADAQKIAASSPKICSYYFNPLFLADK